MSHTEVARQGLAVLIAADVLLASAQHWGMVIAGVALWGIHMGMTGLLATMVANTAPRRSARGRPLAFSTWRRYRHAGGQRHRRTA